MYSFLQSILGDKKGGDIFKCFGAWHFFYIFLAAAAAAVFCLLLRKKGQNAKDRAADALICIAFGLYMLDFFIMPLAYGEIDIEKLPFHACTATCVMCFLSRRAGFLKNLRVHFALLGFISNFVYLVYPAGVMWHAVHPLCYRVVQTLVFHAVMTVYGLVTLVFDEKRLSFGTLYKDAAVLAGMILWALLGNTVYNGPRFYNWFFVVGDPFGMIDESIAPFIMPFLDFAVFFAVEVLIVSAFVFARKSAKGRIKND